MLIDKKTRLTTLVLAIGFTLLAITNALAWISKEGTVGLRFIVRWELIYFGAGFCISLLLFRVYSAIEKRLSAAWLIFSSVLICFVAGICWRFIAGTTMWSLGMNEEYKVDFAFLFIRGGLADGTTLGLISFLYFGIQYWRLASEQSERARKATALAHQAQLQMLRYQLNPHFLFNALNSIRGMILEDSSRSREMVAQLADFLRYSLSGKDEESTIADEIDAIENYLAIQRIRFEDRLDATVEVDESAARVSVPFFLIHPLVENAVKYGMKTSPMPLRIRIAVKRSNDEVEIYVSNTGKLVVNDAFGDESIRPQDGTGIGLKNITERLQLIFPDQHEFKIWESEGWVRAEIRFKPGVLERLHEAAYSTGR